MEDIVTLGNLDQSISDFTNALSISSLNEDAEESEDNDIGDKTYDSKLREDHSVTDRLEGHFVSKNVVNLSKRDLQ